MKKAYIQLFDDRGNTHKVITTSFEYSEPLTYEELKKKADLFLNENSEFVFIKEINFEKRFKELLEDKELSVGDLKIHKWMEIFI